MSGALAGAAAVLRSYHAHLRGLSAREDRAIRAAITELEQAVHAACERCARSVAELGEHMGRSLCAGCLADVAHAAVREQVYLRAIARVEPPEDPRIGAAERQAEDIVAAGEEGT